jgi:hypothetical protein
MVMNYTSSQMSSMSVSEDVIVALETEIARLQSELVAAKRRRNSFAPLCALPNEIIILILSHIQFSEPKQPVEISKAGRCDFLFDFSHNYQWEQAMMASSRIHEIAMSTPELWTYINLSWSSSKIKRYISHAGNLRLVLDWGTTDNSDLSRRHLDVRLARACFRKSYAASLVVASPHLTRTNETFQDLLILHLDMNRKTAFLQSCNTYPALVELSITNAWIKDGINVQVPSLTRLNLQWTSTDERSGSVVRFLQHTPRLADLRLYCPSTSYGNLPFDTPPNTLILPHLRKLVLSGNPYMVWNFLRALSLDTPQLQDLTVESPMGYTTASVCKELFLMISTRWTSMSGLPLPSARLTYWFFPAGRRSQAFMIVTPPGAVPALNVREAPYSNELVSLYRDHGLCVQTIKVVSVGYAGLISEETSWAAELAEIMVIHASSELELKFIKCHRVVAGLETWIRTQVPKGRAIKKIVLQDCGKGATLADYRALKESKLVQQLEWNSTPSRRST